MVIEKIIGRGWKIQVIVVPVFGLGCNIPAECKWKMFTNIMEVSFEAAFFSSISCVYPRRIATIDSIIPPIITIVTIAMIVVAATTSSWRLYRFGKILSRARNSDGISQSVKQ